MLNFDVTKKCLVGEGWCPLLAKTQVFFSPNFLRNRKIFNIRYPIMILHLMIFQMQEALQRATFDSNSQVGIIFHPLEAVESPPTYFRTNTFTNPYQEIVDAYG